MAILTEQLTNYFDRVNLSSSCHYPFVPQIKNKKHRLVHESEHSELESTVAIVDIFPSLAEAQCVVMSMEREGLDSHQILIIAKHEYETENSSNWEHIHVDDDLAIFLTELGISDRSAYRFVNAVEDGNFLVMAIGNDWEASKAQHVLDNIGNWQFNEHFKSIVTLPEQLKNIIRKAICIN
jgi:hypothetical protein